MDGLILGPGDLSRIRPHLHHVGLDGSPCIEAGRLAELLLGLGGDAGGEQ